jgi:hypothetical protein
MSVKIFPTVMILLSLGASFVYICQGDIRHAIYWFAAAVLNSAITF